MPAIRIQNKASLTASRNHPPPIAPISKHDNLPTSISNDKDLVMKLGYTIVYVPDVAASLAFFKQAFGLEQRFLHESGTYGELETGATTLAFAAHELGDMKFPGGHVRADTSAQPLGMEIGLVTEDVASAYQKAIAAGCN